MHKKKTIPKHLQGVFWSYNIKNLDIERDKQMIITQLLNHGQWCDLKWLYSVYEETEIKAVVEHPQRGMWYERVLNFWVTMLNCKVPKRIYKQAIIRPNLF
jgi:hypothetical protein